MEKNAVGGSRCLQCAAKQKPSESATGVSERADRSAVQIHSAGRAGKGVSQEIVEASNSCRGNLQSLRSFARLNGKTWQATCRRIVLALLVVANPAAVQRSPNHHNAHTRTRQDLKKYCAAKTGRLRCPR